MLLLSVLTPYQVACLQADKVGGIGKETGIVTLGYRYCSIKVPVSLISHGRDKIFSRPW